MGPFPILAEIEARCTGKKMTKMIAIEAEKYRKGIGVEKDPVRAFELYQIAYGRGFDGAEYRLAEAYRKGEGTERNPAKAMEMYRESAEGGNVGAVYRMAEMYRRRRRHRERSGKGRSAVSAGRGGGKHRRDLSVGG